MEQQNANDQEIDLSQLFQNIKKLYNYILYKIFDGILFIKKNIVALILLTGIGVIVGFFLNFNAIEKGYEQKIIVTPNFNSIDYLYNKIDLINSKLVENDKTFFKSIGIINYKLLSKVKIEPIIDIYKFVENSKQPTNLEVLKFLKSDSDIDEILENHITSKNFPNHLISFTTTDSVNRRDIIAPLMAYFNDSDYYTEIQKIANKSTLNKLIENDSIILQIDKILAQYSSSNTNAKNEKLLFFSENTQLSNLIDQKLKLIKEKEFLEMDLINGNQIIKEVSITPNMFNTITESSNNVVEKPTSYELILPFILIIAFVFIKLFISYYKSQIKKRNLI